MTDPSYNVGMGDAAGPKRLAWLKGEIKTPPFSEAARRSAGLLIRRLQRGELLGLPHSRPMPAIGPRCHELRISDGRREWRIFYRLDPAEILILDVTPKATQKAPQKVIDGCKVRLRDFDAS
jgi:phage-related protein